MTGYWRKAIETSTLQFDCEFINNFFVDFTEQNKMQYIYIGRVGGE